MLMESAFEVGDLVEYTYESGGIIGLRGIVLSKEKKESPYSDLDQEYNALEVLDEDGVIFWYEEENCKKVE